MRVLKNIHSRNVWSDEIDVSTRPVGSRVKLIVLHFEQPETVQLDLLWETDPCTGVVPTTPFEVSVGTGKSRMIWRNVDKGCHVVTGKDIEVIVTTWAVSCSTWATAQASLADGPTSIVGVGPTRI